MIVVRLTPLTPRLPKLWRAVFWRRVLLLAPVPHVPCRRCACRVDGVPSNPRRKEEDGELSGFSDGFEDAAEQEQAGRYDGEERDAHEQRVDDARVETIAELLIDDPEQEQRPDTGERPPGGGRGVRPGGAVKEALQLVLLPLSPTSPTTRRAPRP